MVDDFENYADLNGGATAGSIREAADSPSTHTATMQTLVNDLANDSQEVRANVEGDIADATTMNVNPASDAARRLTQSGLFAVGLLNSFADTVETFDTEVEAINTLLNDNTYSRWQAQNDSTSDNSEAGSASGDPTDLSYSEIKAQEKAKLQARYNTAVTTLETETDRVAGLFEGSPDLGDVKALILAGYIPLQFASIWPTLQLTDAERQQAQIGTVRQMTDEEQAEYVRNTDDIPAEVLAVITPAAQGILANDVAKDIKDKSIDAETVRVLAHMQDQPAFAHAFYSKVTPDQMADAIADLSSETYPNGIIRSGTSIGAGMEPIDQSKVDLYKGFLSAAGGTLATYSTGTGAHAPPANAGETWGKAITSEADGDSQNAGALSLLLREGGQTHTFDGDFLSDVADEVYTYERDHENDAPWGSRGSQVVDPDARIGNSDDAWFGVRSSDAMSNVLGAMKNSPEAAQTFFADGYPDGDTSKENDRLKYLLTERTFSKDLADTKGGDEGDGLGLALEAATIGGNERTEFGTTLAEQTFQMIADKSGTGDSGINPFDGTWHTWPGLTDSLGTIAAGYAADIYDLIDNNPQDGATHLDISQETLDKLLGEIGRGEDKTGIETLTAATVIEGNDRIGEKIESWRAEHPGEPLTMEALSTSGLGSLLEGQGSTNGEIIKHLLDKSVLVDLDDEERAATRQAYIEKAFDIATAFAPGAADVLGEAAGDVAKTTYDTLSGEALGALKDQVAGAPDALSDKYTQSQEKALPDKFEYGLVNELYQHGYLGAPDGTPIPDSLLTGPEGNRMIRPDLYDADGIDSFNTDGMSAADIAQLKQDWGNWQDSNQRNFAETIAASILNGFDRGAR